MSDPAEVLEDMMRDWGAAPENGPWWQGLAIVTALMIRSLHETEEPSGYFALDFGTDALRMHLLAVEHTPHAMREVARWAMERLEEMDDGE